MFSNPRSDAKFLLCLMLYPSFRSVFARVVPDINELDTKMFIWNFNLKLSVNLPNESTKSMLFFSSLSLISMQISMSLGFKFPLREEPNSITSIALFFIKDNSC